MIRDWARAFLRSCIAFLMLVAITTPLAQHSGWGENREPLIGRAREPVSQRFARSRCCLFSRCSSSWFFLVCDGFGQVPWLWRVPSSELRPLWCVSALEAAGISWAPMPGVSGGTCASRCRLAAVSRVWRGSGLHVGQRSDTTACERLICAAGPVCTILRSQQPRLPANPSPELLVERQGLGPLEPPSCPHRQVPKLVALRGRVAGARGSPAGDPGLSAVSGHITHLGCDLREWDSLQRSRSARSNHYR